MICQPRGVRSFPTPDCTRLPSAIPPESGGAKDEGWNHRLRQPFRSALSDPSVTPFLISSFAIRYHSLEHCVHRLSVPDNAPPLFHPFRLFFFFPFLRRISSGFLDAPVTSICDPVTSVIEPQNEQPLGAAAIRILARNHSSTHPAPFACDNSFPSDNHSSLRSARDHSRWDRSIMSILPICV